MNSITLRSIALLVSAVCLGQAQTVSVSESMTLDEIGQAMEAYPPRWEFGDQRAAIPGSKDKHNTMQI